MNVGRFPSDWRASLHCQRHFDRLFFAHRRADGHAFLECVNAERIAEYGERAIEVWLLISLVPRQSKQTSVREAQYPSSSRA